MIDDRGSQYLTFSWEHDTPDVDGYLLVVGDRSFAVDEGETSFRAQDLHCGKTYETYIQAFRHESSGIRYTPASESINATTLDCVYPQPTPPAPDDGDDTPSSSLQAPSNLASSFTVSGTSVYVDSSWQDNSNGEDGFQISVEGPISTWGTSFLYASSNSTSKEGFIDFASSLPEGQYTVQVRAYEGSGTDRTYSSWSNSVTLLWGDAPSEGISISGTVSKTSSSPFTISYSVNYDFGSASPNSSGIYGLVSISLYTSGATWSQSILEIIEQEQVSQQSGTISGTYIVSSDVVAGSEEIGIGMYAGNGTDEIRQYSTGIGTD